LAWRCVADSHLVERAVDLAGRAARAPVELAKAVKGTLRRAPWHESFDAAVDAELEQQVWSTAQGFFAERMSGARRTKQ
jgi:enoyl-CoA hydratase/carnithine racemase